jgi:flagellar biosynthesis protein FlhG
MSQVFEDQAAGLRRLFHSAPPEVFTVVPCGAAAMQWVARQLALRVQAGRRVLALDECMACGNLADALGVSPRFDLLQAAEGHVPAERCLVEAMPGLQLAPVGRLARALGADRITDQRVAAQFQQLQAGFDEWMVLARPSDLHGLSPLVLAAPRLLLVVDAHPISIMEAYTTLKRIATGADILSIGLAMANRADPEAQALAANLLCVVKRQLGLEVEAVASVGESLVLGYDSGRAPANGAFVDRLLKRAQMLQRSQIIRKAVA